MAQNSLGCGAAFFFLRYSPRFLKTSAMLTVAFFSISSQIGNIQPTEESVVDEQKEEETCVIFRLI